MRDLTRRIERRAKVTVPYLDKRLVVGISPDGLALRLEGQHHKNALEAGWLEVYDLLRKRVQRTVGAAE